MFSVIHVCLFRKSPHVIITHDAFGQLQTYGLPSTNTFKFVYYVSQTSISKRTVSFGLKDFLLYDYRPANEVVEG